MRQAHIVTGLGYGDEGKGSWVDHIVRKHGIKYIVRHNGGAQAMHHVVGPDGRHHRFAQFGSGMLVPDTYTCLSRFMLIEPEALLQEAHALEGHGVHAPLSRQIVSENAPIITPFNRLLNRIQEVARGASRHGSCGFGIGITQNDVETLAERALYVRDLADGSLRDKLVWLHETKVNDAAAFETEENLALCEKLREVGIDHYVTLFKNFHAQVNVLSEDDFSGIIRNNDVVFEGAQGVLLDQCHGFFPHCTRSTCTFENALQLLREAEFDGDIQRIGLLRAYGTRHGAGPFVTEDTHLPVTACHNGENQWQGRFRVGWFDAVAARYALEAVDGVDLLAITNLDRMQGIAEVKIGVEYEKADPRFFTRERIKPLACNYSTLAERTATMHSIEPSYEQVRGWTASGSTSAIESYLKTLEQLLEMPIGAYSTSPEPQKLYRPG